MNLKKLIFTVLLSGIACVCASAQTSTDYYPQKTGYHQQSLGLNAGRYASYGWRAPLKSGLRAASLPGKCLVIFAEYEDQRCYYTLDQLKNMLTEPGYKFENSKGSAKEYLDAQLGGNMEFTVLGIVRAPKDREYYGENDGSRLDIHAGEFIADVCSLAAQQNPEVDFKQFDSDGDGIVDQVFVFYAGEDEAQQAGQKHGGYMWSHSGTLAGSDYGKMLDLGNVKINRYACSAEQYMIYTSASEYTTKLAPIGTFCHEYLHCLGLSDCYDTDYEKSGGTSAGLWRTTSIMDSGNYNNNGCLPPHLNVIDREILGITEPEELQSGNYSTTPAGTAGSRYFKISNPNDKDEYYLLECRDAAEGTYDQFIGGSGMLVYHIDRSAKYSTRSDVYGKDITSYQRWAVYNEVNCRPDHQCADLIEADSRKDADVQSSAFADIKGIFFPYAGASALGGDAKIPLKFWDGTTSAMAITAIKFENGLLSFTVSNIYSPIPPAPVNPPAADDALYLIIKYKSNTADITATSVPAGTVIDAYVSNSVNTTEVKYFLADSPVADPANIVLNSSAQLRAEITWEDGSVDYLFKNFVVR